LPAVASCDDTFVKVVFNWEPSEFTTVMITTEIPAAIKPYSMAVAPDSSQRNRLRMHTDLNSLIWSVQVAYAAFVFANLAAAWAPII
jgi:hypothetical protein